MEMKKVEISVPEAMMPFVLLADDVVQLKQNAMLLYPYIQDSTISHGKAAEILGVHKLDLITLYGKLGLPYMQETEDELKADLLTVRNLREKAR